MNEPTPIPPAGWTALRVLGVLITVLASIATLVALWLQVRETQPHVTAQLLILRPAASDSTSTEYARAILAMQDRPVFTLDHTWHVKVRVVNDGELTLFTSGPKQNVLTEELKIEFPGRATILSFGTDIEGNALEENMQLEATRKTLSMKFTQWRSGEAVVLDVVVGDSTPGAGPFPAVVDRPVADGEFVIADLTSSSSSAPTHGLTLPFRPRTAILLSLVTAAVGLALVVAARRRSRSPGGL